MKRIVLFLFSILLAYSKVSADGVSVCRDIEAGGMQFIFSGMDWNSEVNAWWVADGASIEGNTLRADANVSGEYEGQVVFAYWDGNDYVWVYANENTAACGEVWQPSAPSILIDAPNAGPYLIEIRDKYGHWSVVEHETDQGRQPVVLYNNGGHVELIGSVGQDTNPESYRLIELDG